MKIKDIMIKKVVTVELDDSLRVVKELFEKTNFHHLAVVHDGKLYGIISDRDLLKSISPNIGTMAATSKDMATLNKKVHQVMTRQPITSDEESSVRDAIHIFNTNKISCIPIVGDSGYLVGMVSWRDILRNIEKMMAPEIV
ncbi:CBS domain-containing protein [Zhongshania sp.]|uniref:CBS domain-containing protein n=1 Tax=Zhongshania sp. TaxID=1971902 RepID=UPI001B6F89C3|nr:CBS domain-containing protein [Zhongshania sp.]MBQ0795931.1 CBS domain-containing protein [Zhongshania sp.]